jgi:endonuclease/exonuclease/phosphatase family metal-dependent hydrolase
MEDASVAVSTHTPAVFAALLVAALGAGCAGRYSGMADLAPASSVCRTPATASVGTPPAIGWLAPAAGDERLTLEAWCGATGPPVIAPSTRHAPPPTDELAIVSWNLHVGAADVPELVRRLRDGAFTGGSPVTRFVLLLQEAHRAGPEVPPVRRGTMPVPAAIRPPTAGRERHDIVATARALGLALYYAPSMRNGPTDDTDEDRGNAILSTEPLSALSAIELPFERQRRVAVSAYVTGRDPTGRPWRLRVVSAHLDSLASARRLWISGPRTRARQTRGLLDALDTGTANEPLVLGGDLNTWLGFSDPAYRALARVMPDVARHDRRPTFAGLLRLDHLFARLPRDWTVGAARLDDRLGSDHHAILARVRIAS